MADLQKISQVYAQVEWEDPRRQKISQVYTQVEYGIGMLGTGGCLCGGTGSAFGTAASASYSISGAEGGLIGGSGVVAKGFIALGSEGGLAGGSAAITKNFNGSISGAAGGLIGGTGSPIGSSGLVLRVNIGGVWKTANAVYVKVGGAWKQVATISVKINGEWKTTA
jgi:hypothetical protein